MPQHVFGTLHRICVHQPVYGVRSDKQYSPLRMGEHPATMIIFPFFPLRSLSFSCIASGLFLDHLLDIVIMSSQFGSAEVGFIHCSLSVESSGNDADSGLPDITHILSGQLRLCASLDAMLQGLICMLDFVACFFPLFTIDLLCSLSQKGFLG